MKSSTIARSSTMKSLFAVLALSVVAACGGGASAPTDYTLKIALYSEPVTVTNTATWNCSALGVPSPCIVDNGFAHGFGGVSVFSWQYIGAAGNTLETSQVTILNDNTCLTLTAPLATSTVNLVVYFGLIGQIASSPPVNGQWPSHSPTFFISQPYWTVTLPPFNASAPTAEHQAPPALSANVRETPPPGSLV